MEVAAVIQRELNFAKDEENNVKVVSVKRRKPFVPSEHGLREDFCLTDFSALKG